MDSNLKIDNTDKIDQYLMIKQNKNKFNDFIKKERQFREKNDQINKKVKTTMRDLPETLEDIQQDPDLGMGHGIEEPKMSLPT